MKTSPTKLLIRKAISLTVVFCFGAANLALTQAFASTPSAYRGIAPDAKIISVKVLSNDGTGQTSWLLNRLNWVLQNRSARNIPVVNLSLGTLAIDTYTNDPICLKVKELAQAGIVVVAAAGNLGRGPDGQKMYGGIHSPGNSP